ncbi:hypothetical protein Fcan01_27270 [Folsomia candida]|uniref:Uncharacterized protein n=1 Tax=Folsomia candida TaxID=158441 RepID=A0A226CYQ7_FOLCA|nr:hypothetical protein Fcan01_27270 [Folsomia candida]
MEGDRDLNNNLLSSPSSSPLSKNNDKIPPTSPTLKISGKIKTETKTNNPPLKISSPQKVMSPKKLPVSISMPVLCSILWIFLCFIGTTNADQNQNRDQFAPQPGHSSSPSILSHAPGQIVFPSDYDDEQENPGVEHLQTIEDDGSILFTRRTGRVLTNSTQSKTNATSKSASTSSEENGSSRKASPDVQDIIDGIVKLLGGKVHNGTPPNQNSPPGGRPLTSPNPYNLFNPTKPFFPPKLPPPQTPKPTRINNRGPVLPGQQQHQNLDQQSSSFEAIPIEALSEFNLDNGSNFGPPFPISGNGGGVIQPNYPGGSGGGGGNRIEPPYKQGVPLPEMVVPQGGQYPPGSNNNNQQQQFYQPPQQNYPPGGGNYPSGNYPGGNYPPGGNFPNQNQYQKQPPTRYQIVPNTGLPPTQPSYNPFGFEHPHPNTTPASNSNNPPPSTHLLPPPVSKRPVIKFPTDGDNLEDDEAEEARFTTPKVPPQRISPTLASSVGGGESSVYPTLLLSSNKNNGLVELVTEFTESTSSSSTVESSKVTTLTTTTTTSPGTNKPIFYPNNSYRTTTTTTNPPPKSTNMSPTTSPTSSTSPDLSIHSLPTPPLRPGIVISDVPSPPRTPGGVGSVEVVTADEGHSLLGSGIGQIGDIFDVTVTAKQNYGGGGGSTISPFSPPISSEDEVLTAPKGTEQFVSIDGKRTYFNLHPNTASTALSPTRPTQTVTGTSAPPPPPPPQISGGGNIGVGSVGAPVPLLPQPPGKTLFNSGTPIRSTSLSISGGSSGGALSDKGLISKTPPNIIRRPLTRRPSVPPVRIDTCIVGDDSTCNSDAAEVCRTENGVSSCICRPGFARRRHREPCKAIYSLILSIKLDKLGDKKLNYDPDYFNPSSETYQTIEWETIHALDASLAETSLSPTYVGSKLDAIGFDGKHAVVNATVLLQENGKLAPAQLKKELQKQMIQVLTRHRNNFGKSQLWVEGPISAVSAITDVNECDDGELNDCSSKADCINTFGSFECRCFPGYGDAWEHDKRRGGRKCAGNYYGSQCDIDGEVLAVAIGASVSAVVIIGLTLACLCMWSRKWKKEEQKAALMSRTLFGGMANQALSYLGGQKTNPYQQHVTMDERLRWAQVAESNMTGNIYVQNDGGMSMPCGMGGQQLMDTPPMMARRSADTVDTTFQGGSIYYDLEPDQTEIYASRSMMHFPPPPAQFCVPMTPMGHYAQQGRGGFYS